MNDESSLIYPEISLISNLIAGQKVPVRAIDYEKSTKKDGKMMLVVADTRIQTENKLQFLTIVFSY